MYMFYDRFKALCENKKTSPTRAAIDMGFSNSITTKWKKTGATPDGVTLAKIAEYFGITVDELLGKEKQPTEGELSGIRKDLMDFADTLTDEKIEKYLRLMKTLESEDI